MKFKLIISFSILLIVSISTNFNLFNNINYHNRNDYNALKVNNIDNTPPSIKLISPSKFEEYIISKPTIKIEYFDESKIDISSIKLHVNYEDVTNKCEINENEILYTPITKFKRGSQIISLEVKDSSPNKNTYKSEWYFVVGTPVYNHYKGLLHSHTSSSDGHGSYSDAYYLARDKANLDFFAITEHSNMLDNFLDCTINDASKSKEWNELIKYSTLFTSNGNFIALNGFEMSYPYKVENPIGHINIFGSNGFVSEKHKEMDLENFYKFIYNKENLIGQFNHPCDKFGNFNNFKYCPYADEVICLLEVGNGYYKDMNKNIKSHDMYQLALDKGWHVAPTCNQDNHIVNFAIANEFRTVILSTELSKDSLYDALKNMRVYASEDKNLNIEFTINDLPIGSTISKSSKLDFCISAIDNDLNDKIKEIQVITNNGKIIREKKFDSNLAKLEFNIKSEKNKFYYIKIIQNNNKISVTAPIWIK